MLKKGVRKSVYFSLYLQSPNALLANTVYTGDHLIVHRFCLSLYTL